ncbi:hypothetical protein FNV43_RR20049 [Rhamnella rubrinervis]|uniref:Uncharacterized protein n=1 Tax=Rhamnella rubrinervis TaxID=2594499 RepID=A0A8K0DYZ6_9ROSA|nr:hypothetical protein FNV43_RR20049 [Rhamnella rubrinervis]
MAKPSTVKLKVVERCHVSPQPTSSSAPPPTSECDELPLTFLDIPWLFFPPSQLLFLYEFNYPTSHFTTTILPNLKHALSLALHYFYPFAGTLHLPPQPTKPKILCNRLRDSVCFTVAESVDADFLHLSSDSHRDAALFHPLLPQLDYSLLTSPVTTKPNQLPLLAIQVTVFPNSGICIGLSYHHVLADARTFNNFLKTWAAFSSTSLGGDSYLSTIKSTLPSYDRRVIVDAHGLESIFLEEWWKKKRARSSRKAANDVAINMVRATFVVYPRDMEMIKSWILAQCEKKNEAHPVHLSPYVLTCAFIWVCLVKAQEQAGGGVNGSFCFGEDPNYFGFIAGGITRMCFPVPPTYLGNCVGFGRSTATRKELMGEDGIVIAARAIGSTIKRLDKDVLGEAERWIPEWEVLIGSDIHMMASGSPKVDLYGRDFGWGRPKKIEEVAIDRTRAVSLTETRHVKGGIEVGLVLEKPLMEAFTSFFNGGLRTLLS